MAAGCWFESAPDGCLSQNQPGADIPFGDWKAIGKHIRDRTVPETHSEQRGDKWRCCKRRLNPHVFPASESGQWFEIQKRTEERRGTGSILDRENRAQISL